MTEPKPDFRRLSDYLKEYWDAARGSRQFPSLRAIDMMALAPEFRKDCFLLSSFVLTIEQLSARALFIGENLHSFYANDILGEDAEHMAIRFLQTPNSPYIKVMNTRKPLTHNAEFSPTPNGNRVRYRQILLPLGPVDEQPITAILGGMRYKKE